MKRVPVILIYSRLLLGILIFIFSFVRIPGYPAIAVILFSIGLLTDIFDGIIARRLQVSTRLLRRLDSLIDQVFFILVAAAVYLQHPSFFYENKWQLIILFSSEILIYLVSFIKFSKEVATHTITSKIWALILFATLVQVILAGSSHFLFQLCFYSGIISRLEIVVILLLIREWANDVPGIKQAILLRNGKPVKRHKLLNG